VLIAFRVMSTRWEANRLSRCPADAPLMNWCPDQGQDQVMRTDPFPPRRE